MMDWRKIESEILDFLEREVLVIGDYIEGDCTGEGAYIEDTGKPIVERLARQIADRLS